MVNVPPIKQAMKVAWLLLVVSVVGYFIFQRWDSLVPYLKQLSWPIIVISFATMTLAKLCLTYVMQQAALRNDIDITYAQSFWIYNLTQLPKYIPGSIWQFVGRIAVLKKIGFALGNIRDSMIIEHLWVIGSAAILGFPVLIFRWSELDKQLAVDNLAWLIVVAMGASAVLVAAVAILRPTLRRKVLSYCQTMGQRLVPPPATIVALVACWLLFGVAFWITVTPLTFDDPMFVYAVSVYCLAYVIGFLVPFAPAGIGVREFIIFVGLIGFLSIEGAFLVAALNRAAYLLVEAFLGIISTYTSGIYMNRKLPAVEK